MYYAFSLNVGMRVLGRDPQGITEPKINPDSKKTSTGPNCLHALHMEWNREEGYLLTIPDEHRLSQVFQQKSSDIV